MQLWPCSWCRLLTAPCSVGGCRALWLPARSIVFHEPPLQSPWSLGRRIPCSSRLCKSKASRPIRAGCALHTAAKCLLSFGVFYSLFVLLSFSLCFEGTRARSLGLPCPAPCRGPSWARVSAFPWRWAQRSCPQGQEVLSSFSHASRAGSALLSDSLPTHTVLSAALASSAW